MVQEVEGQRNLFGSYERLGSRPERAKAWYEKALVLSEALAEQTRTLQAYDDLAVSCYRLGVLGNYDYLRRAYDIWSTLAEQCPDVPTYVQRRDIARRYLE